MLGTRINTLNLNEVTILNNRILKSQALTISLVCLLGASACTSSNSSPSLIAKPTIAETLSSVDGTDTQNDIQSDADLPSPELSQIPLPKPAPNITSQNGPKHQTSLIAEATTKDAPTISEANTAQIKMPNANASTSNTSGGEQNSINTASIKREPPTRKLNFFERLLKSRRDKQTSKNLNSKKSQLDAEVLRRAKANSSQQIVALDNKTAQQAKPDIKEGVKLLTVKEDPNHQHDSRVQVASVGALGRTSGPFGLILQTQGVQIACLKPPLVAVLKKVERRFGKKVMVTSGYRSPARNRRAGGVKNSHHTTCSAADIQVAGISKWNVAKYLRSINGRGGVGTYCRTKSVHIDIGSQRDWHQPCRRRK